MKQNEIGQSAAKSEIWKVIEEFDEYEVSSHGRVRCIKTGKILAYGNRKRYYTVALHQNGTRKDCYVHRLVALAFILNQDSAKRYVNHLDHDIHNNNVENLEWCTSSENARHSHENGRRKEEYLTVRKDAQKKMTKAVKKPVVQLSADGKRIKVFESGVEAARITGISSSQINAVCHHLYGRKTAGGYKWEFLKGSTTMREKNPISPAQDAETSEEIV